MKQAYHSNATTNIHIRCALQKSNLPVNELAVLYKVSKNTISKWKNRVQPQDCSSRPHTIYYALTYMEQHIIKSIRRSTWIPLDEIVEMAQYINPTASHSAVYRTLCAAGLNKVPQQERDKAKKFKAYEPGYLHVDVTYLPKLEGTKQYLFVAIDRATRTLFYWVYESKTAENTEDFMERCKKFFPFRITHILTDNGLEFTNRLLLSKTGIHCNKPSKMDAFCKAENIAHRLTKPSTPKTNGMVERVNGTIKSNTILTEQYHSKEEMNTHLMQFLVFYLLYRRHGSLKKELGVKTPFEAIEKWHELKPELFLQKPLEFKNNVLLLYHQTKLKQVCLAQQPCET